MCKEARIALFFLVALSGVSLWLGPWVRDESALQRASYQSAESEVDLAARNQNAFARILGEIRVGAADLMFVKTERYLHAGVAYEAHGAGEEVLRHGDEEAHGHAHGEEDYGDVEMLVRSEENDFRGILGDWQRQIKPYHDVHQHHEDAHAHEGSAELLPWYRLMTLSNPHYIRAYRIGAMELARVGKWEEAIQFLQEGLDKNGQHPRRFLLYQTLTHLHVRGRHSASYPYGDAWRANALHFAHLAFDAGLEQRPWLGKAGQKKKDLVWTDYLEEDFLFIINMLPLLYRYGGEYDEAQEWALRGIELAPDFRPLQETLAKMREEMPDTVRRQQVDSDPTSDTFTFPE